MTEQEQSRQRRKTRWMIGLLSAVTIGLVVWYSIFLFDQIEMLNQNRGDSVFVQVTPGVNGSQVYNGDRDNSAAYDEGDTSLSLNENQASWYNGVIPNAPNQLEKPLHSRSFIQALYEWSRLKLSDSR
ncbi:hypothetical protein [Paenibacillus kandeliae]|uniref:hypothetical protein n=1 Tax=Paenibacillus kandeliae TaxID=3231269 RepID=UPI00345B3CEB